MFRVLVPLSHLQGCYNMLSKHPIIYPIFCINLRKTRTMAGRQGVVGWKGEWERHEGHEVTSSVGLPTRFEGGMPPLRFLYPLACALACWCARLAVVATHVCVVCPCHCVSLRCCVLAAADQRVCAVVRLLPRFLVKPPCTSFSCAEQFMITIPLNSFLNRSHVNLVWALMLLNEAWFLVSWTMFLIS